MDIIGLRLGINPRIAPQVLGFRDARYVVDASNVVKELDPVTGLWMFPIDGVFTDPNVVCLGFGKPNTFLFVPAPGSRVGAPEWKKFAAFMFWRKRSAVVDTKRRVQAGVLVQLLGLSDDAVERLRDAMRDHEKKLSLSCAHLNGQVLAAAGFTYGGSDFSHVYRPSKMFSLIWRFGLEHDDKPIGIRLIQTGNEEVGDHFRAVWLKEITSHYRSVKKKFVGEKPHVSAPTFDLRPEDDPAVPGIEPRGEMLSIGIAMPSRIGVLLGFILGQQPIFVTKLNQRPEAPELNVPLPAFPGELDKVTWVKKNILFRRLVVRILRRQLMASVNYREPVHGSEIIAMLRPSESADPATAYRYNMVMTGEEIIITRLVNGTGRFRRFLDWILAKHVLLADWSNDVLFAGELFRVIDRVTREDEAHVPDDSGTYQPGKKRQPFVEAFLGRLFGVRVKVVSTRKEE